jgi:hypothetical protein
MSELHSIRAAAKQSGIPWSHVVAWYRELKERHRQEHAEANELRAFAWQVANALTPGKWPFWRHGFLGWFGRRVDDHDYTIIPHYDEIAESVALRYPQFSGRDEALWDFLLSPYKPTPAAVELYREALDSLIPRAAKRLPQERIKP